MPRYGAAERQKETISVQIEEEIVAHTQHVLRHLKNILYLFSYWQPT